MPLIPVLGKQRQTDLCEFKASLVYITSSRPARDTETLSQKKKKKELSTIVLSPFRKLFFFLVFSRQGLLVAPAVLELIL